MNLRAKSKTLVDIHVLLLRLLRQIFSPSTPLEIIAACAAFVRDQSCKIQDSGLDITYLIDSRFRRNVERTVSVDCLR